MSRSACLFDLLQLLRRHTRPLSGALIASALQMSLRTLYRDIATLQAQGAHIDGAPGLGYLLRPGFVLPPLIFSADEVEALVLGSRWVAGRSDSRLAVVAWCELRQDLRHLRHFRTDRNAALSDSGLRYPRWRQALLKAWCAREALANTADRN